jgi:branched-chain amino acid transport system substrate-binding protein
VQVFADAFKRAQSLDPEAVRDAIAATELETFYGPVKFDSAGRNVAKPAVLTQIQNGKHVVVAPAHLAKAKPVVAHPPLPAE